ncbi:hypothetical protein GCM10009577_45240 [Streptomyces javensis]
MLEGADRLTAVGVRGGVTPHLAVVPTAGGSFVRPGSAVWPSPPPSAYVSPPPMSATVAAAAAMSAPRRLRPALRAPALSPAPGSPATSGSTTGGGPKPGGTAEAVGPLEGTGGGPPPNSAGVTAPPPPGPVVKGGALLPTPGTAARRVVASPEYAQYEGDAPPCDRPHQTPPATAGRCPLPAAGRPL